MNPLPCTRALTKQGFSQLFFFSAAFICHFVPFFCTPTTLIYSGANLKGSSLQTSVSIILAFIRFCKSTLCAVLAWCVPLLFSSPSLAASQFHNYSSGLKQ